MTIDRRFEQHEIDEAAAEAAHIGGDVDAELISDAQRAVIEGGGGESEGFELAEKALVDHASHGDEHSDQVVFRHQSPSEERNDGRSDGEGDHERTSESSDDEAS
jgi:hypothetical protein